MQGTIKFYNTTKGYGFITSNEGKEYFYHKKQIINAQEPQKGQKAEFQPVMKVKGLQAEQIILQEE